LEKALHHLELRTARTVGNREQGLVCLTGLVLQEHWQDLVVQGVVDLVVMARVEAGVMELRAIQTTKENMVVRGLQAQ